jgi:hypothetical protein
MKDSSERSFGCRIGVSLHGGTTPDRVSIYDVDALGGDLDDRCAFGSF